MKRFLLVFAMLFMVCGVFAEETVLLNVDSFTGVAVEDYAFSEWEVVPQSSLKTVTAIKPDTTKGLGVCVKVPTDREVSYKIVPPYSPFLNEANKGLGYIENVGTLRSIEITVEGINRCDEVYLYVSRNLTDKIGQKIKFNKDLQFIGENKLRWDNPNYITDPNKRDSVPGPAYGNEASNLYIRAIEVRTTLNDKVKSEYSVVYIKDIKVIYDLDKTPEELEVIKESEAIWGLNNELLEAAKSNDIKALEDKKRKNEYNRSLMHQDTENADK